MIQLPDFEWPTVAVPAPGEEAEGVVWSGGDGKPRCSEHPWICLVQKWNSPNFGEGTHICATCMKDYLTEYEKERT